MKRRFPKLGLCLAGIYLVWSVYVYFITLGRSGHEWWPLFLYPIIWPLSLIHSILSNWIFDWCFPGSAPEWAYNNDDYFAGAFYIIVGTIWVWFIGRAISKILTRIFPMKDKKDSA